MARAPDGEAETRLAVYGTLAPGQSNHDQLDGLGGEWRPGGVRGRLLPHGWGAARGYPALILDAEGPEVAVRIFQSRDLPSHWRRLDAFEGEGYQRVVARVRTADGEVEAYIYELAPASRPPG